MRRLLEEPMYFDGPRRLHCGTTASRPGMAGGWRVPESLPVAQGTAQTDETLYYLLCGGWIEGPRRFVPAQPFSARIRGKGGLESAWSAFQVRASNEFWHGN